jgi:hypothetical protein
MPAGSFANAKVTVNAEVITQDDPRHPDYNPEKKDEDTK